jgi:cell division transport system permease protein
MIGFGFANARRELPLGPDESAWFLPGVVALMVYVAALGGVGAIVLADTLRASEQALGESLTLEVPAGASEARLETVLALLRQTPGIGSEHLLEPAETARLLEPWLGPGVPLDQLPAPRLIDLRRDPKVTLDVAKLREQLAAVVPDARLDDPLPAARKMWSARRRIEGVLAAGVAVALLLVGGSAAFAVRTALMAGRSVGELLHVLGAADADIARGFALRALRLGLLGGAVGALAALLTLVFIRGAGSIVQLPAPILTHVLADWRVWADLIGVALAAGLIAMAGAWATALRRLAAMP